MRQFLSAVALTSLAACGGEGIEGEQALYRHVEGSRYGGSADHWIEMRNMAGEWERTGLIFGYADDYDECRKAIAGLNKENYAREYRCTPAN
jgi:hypothetical protein